MYVIILAHNNFHSDDQSYTGNLDKEFYALQLDGWKLLQKNTYSSATLPSFST